MRKIIYLLLLLPVTIFCQTKADDEDYVNDKVLKYDDYNYSPNIKTVQIYESSWEFALPIIDLNGDEQIELNFDDLEADKKQYSISFIHCNADWTPSDLMISEYLSGYFDLNFYNYLFSANTLQKYLHYDILFPQPNLKFTKSGNYIVYVYANGDKKDLVLSRRFLIFDSKATITATFRQTIAGDDQFKKQHIDFTIIGSGYDLTNPYKDMKVAITQNNRWDNSITDIKPTFMGGNTITYSLDDASTFNGGNEFRYFDARSMRVYSEKVKSIYKDDNFKNHIVLYPDEMRAKKPYLFYNDFNGKYLIKNSDFEGNMDVEADYIYVDFFLPYLKPETDGNFYVLGKLTDWRMNKMSKMTYNYKRFGYEAQLYLKQGYYNYLYVLSNDANKVGDETVTEGSYWDTENDYAIFVYHRKIGTYYDQLIGYKKLNSLKK